MISALRRSGGTTTHRLSAALLAAVVTSAALVGAVTPPAAARQSTPSTLGSWAEPVPADPNAGKPDALTCLSDTFCVLADTYGGIYVEKNGNWRKADQLDPLLLVNSVSCVSETFCAATGQNWTGTSGFLMTYDGSTWTEPDFVAGTSVVDVSCTSTTYCLAVDYHGGYYTYDGTSWSAPQQISSDVFIYQVSCVSSTFCVAMDDLGGPWMYDGTTWTFYGLGGHYLGYALECLSTSWCVITTTYGVRTWDGSQWTYSADFSTQPLIGTSCASPTFCLAVTEHGAAYRFNGSSWTLTDPVAEAEPVTVTCLSTRTCYETGWSGYVYRFSRGSWSAGVLVDLWAGDPTSLSCPTDDFCLLVDYQGNSVTYANGKWHRARQRPFHTVTNYVPIVSCSSPTLCVVVDDHTAFVVRDGHWSKPTDLGDILVFSLSCAESGFCAAVGFHGRSVTYDGSSWSRPKKVVDRGSLNAVSCVSASFCMAVQDRHGVAVLYDGQGWHEVGDPVGDGAGVACSSPTFCVAVSGRGQYSTWNGATWSAASYFSDGHAVFDLSCPVDGFCQALVHGNHVYTYSSGQWTKTAQLGKAKGEPYGLLSCTTTVTCTAVSNDGWARRYS